ncbi:MAG: SDR family NAD(P)-dependent oxidoreductase [Chloroflexota bacterium]|nr:SDR family NAD(P)-dependent oxidoreductase [Chloroflexota bacterium]
MASNEEKVALITGASSGIGEATALALAAQGMRVVLAARRVERLDALAERIERAGGEAFCVTADVTQERETAEMVSRAREQWGRIDILVNNAGVMLLGPIDGADTEDWRRMVQTNLMGLLYATHRVLPVMKAQGSGHIVNISSVAGRIARAGSAVYNATKWGVVAFSEALRQECIESNIRVTVVEPGIVDTELGSHITHAPAREGLRKRIEEITPLRAEDIANAIVYAVAQPPHVNVNEILIRPTQQDR